VAVTYLVFAQGAGRARERAVWSIHPESLMVTDDSLKPRSSITGCWAWSPLWAIPARDCLYDESPFLDDIYRTKERAAISFAHSGSELGLEIEQFNDVKGKRLNTHLQDPARCSLSTRKQHRHSDRLADQGWREDAHCRWQPVSVKYESGTARESCFKI